MVSPRPSWSSLEESGTGWAASWAIAISNDTRVRVDGYSKIIATDLPRRRPAKSSGVAFALAARSSSHASSSEERSSIERKSRSTVAVYPAGPGTVHDRARAAGVSGPELGPHLASESIDDSGDRLARLLVGEGSVGRAEVHREREALLPGRQG